MNKILLGLCQLSFTSFETFTYSTYVCVTINTLSASLIFCLKLNCTSLDVKGLEPRDNLMFHVLYLCYRAYMSFLVSESACLILNSRQVRFCGDLNVG